MTAIVEADGAVDQSVPAVPDLVELLVMNPPLTLPVPVILNSATVVLLIDPALAASTVHVSRADSE